MAERAAVPSDKRRRIAIVEDDPPLAELLSYNIDAAGYAAEHVADGHAALERLQADPPDMVVLDWVLPGLAGIEVLRRLRAKSSTSTLPVVMLTGRDEPADRQRALHLGVDAYIAKPFRVHHLLDVVAAVLSRHGAPIASPAGVREDRR